MWQILLSSGSCPASRKRLRGQFLYLPVSGRIPGLSSHQKMDTRTWNIRGHSANQIRLKLLILTTTGTNGEQPGCSLVRFVRISCVPVLIIEIAAFLCYSVAGIIRVLPLSRSAPPPVLVDKSNLFPVSHPSPITYHRVLVYQGIGKRSRNRYPVVEKVIINHSESLYEYCCCCVLLGGLRSRASSHSEVSTRGRAGEDCDLFTLFFVVRVFL